MPKRAPYLEIIATIMVMAFLALIVAGGFDQGSDEVGRLTMRSD
jgi:hypothetical protein